MNIQQFFEAYEDLWIESNKDSDQSTQDQCIDLWRAYNRKVIKAPDIFGNPPDIWNNYQQDFYERIKNTPSGVPQLGDVMVWGTRYGKYGHIAICTDIANTGTFTSFDQNDPLGSSCHFQPHKYTGLLGWLRPKNQEAIHGHAEQNIVLELIAGAYGDLLDDDPLKQGNLEGYCRAITEEHKSYAENRNKAEQLDGFIAKWVQEWNLESGSNLVEIENEMSKYITMEDRVNQYRDAIEKLVGPFENDDALLLALKSFKSDKKKILIDLKTCQAKLPKGKIIKVFEVGKWFTIKVWDKRGGERK